MHLESFSVTYRNFGHWDINGKEARLFRIRGGPGHYSVIDERERGIEIKIFKTVQACMGFICDELMFQLIMVDGQNPDIIENWNIPTP